MPSSRRPERRPTDAELAILNVLWQREAATVREVHDRLNHERKIGYTTVLKTMQIMFDKGLVERKKHKNTHRYRAATSEETTQRRLVRDLLQRAFGNSSRKLVLQALTETPTSSKELAEIRRLIDSLDGEEPE